MTVEFGHCDPARMVTPKHLFEYFDNGTWSLFEAALGVNRQDFLNVFGILPLVDVRLDYRKTLSFGEARARTTNDCRNGVMHLIRRVTDEAKEFSVIAVYLFVCFTALFYLKA